MGKIISKDDLKRKVEEFRHRGWRIGTTNGCFDVIHYGHIQLLKVAKASCDILVVGLNSDASVKRLKGPTRPIHNQRARAYVLNELIPVDYVYIFEEDDPTNFLRLVKPIQHTKSKGGYKGIEEPILKEWNGKLNLLDDVTSYSTSEILRRLKDEV